MQTAQLTPSNWMLRITRGEQIISSIAQFCKEHHIKGGYFSGLGAVDVVELAHYDVNGQKYSSKKFAKAFEVTNITGTVGVADELIVHAHITLSDTQMRALGGHLIEATVSGTIELYFTKTAKLTKQFDPETGLKLFIF